jgi:beta-glucanase (GH16 family)
LASCYANNAFWLYVSKPLGCGWNEIDILEGHPAKRCRQRPKTAVGNLFADTLWIETPIHATTVSPNAHGGVPHKLACALDRDYHTYGLEWDEQSLKIYFDGKCVSTYSNKHCHEPLWLTFNLTAYPESEGQPLDRDLPAIMRVEYVRAWERTDIDNSKRIWTYNFRLPDNAASKPGYLIPEVDGSGRLKVYTKDGKSQRLGLDYVNKDYFAKQTAETIRAKVRVRAKDNNVVVFTFDWKRGKGDDLHSGYVAENVRLDTDVKLGPRQSEEYVFLADGGKEVALAITH